MAGFAAFGVFSVLAILSLTAPIYLMIALGYLALRKGLLQSSDMPVLGRFVVQLALPALVFKAVAVQPLAQVLRWDYVLVYGGGSVLAMVLGRWWCLRVLQQSQMQSAISAMGMACPNSGFVGYPMVLLLLPVVAGSVLALNMLIENLLLIPWLLLWAERAKQGQECRVNVWRTLAQLVRSPLMLGLGAGLLVAASGWELPAVVMRTVDMVGATCGAVSLILIGGTLSGFVLQGQLTKMVVIACGKLLLHPLCVWLVLMALPSLGMPALQGPWAAAVVLSAAMPMFGIYPTLAQSYGESEMSAGALLVATMASFISITGLLGIMAWQGWI